MANRFFKRVGSLLGRPHILSGRFTADASATADTNDRGYTVAQTATGIWTVTFADAWQNAPNVVVSLELAATDTGDWFTNTRAVTSSSFIVENRTQAGTLADVASAFIAFMCLIDDSNS